MNITNRKMESKKSESKNLRKDFRQGFRFFSPSPFFSIPPQPRENNCPPFSPFQFYWLENNYGYNRQKCRSFKHISLFIEAFETYLFFSNYTISVLIGQRMRVILETKCIKNYGAKLRLQIAPLLLQFLQTKSIIIIIITIIIIIISDINTINVYHLIISAANYNLYIFKA